MRLTDLTIACPKTRQWRKSITMQQSLQARMQYHAKNSKELLTPTHQARYTDLDNHLTQTIARLDRDELISHPVLGNVLTRPVKQTISWVFEGLRDPGPAQHDTVTAALVELMNNKGRDARAAQHKFNLASEIAYRTYHNWYLCFNTLTVEPGKYYHVFKPKSTEFQTYIRNVQRLVNKAENGDHATRPTDQPANGSNHTYFACVEEGSINGRLHIHVLHFFRTLPSGSHDPNRGKLRPTNRELGSIKALWPNGHSLPIAVRYSPNDAYGKILNWRWPFDLERDNAYKIGSPLRLSSYMSKYITKSYTSCKRTQHLWRVRKSHKLGQDILSKLVSSLSKEALILLATNDTIKLTFNNTRIPPHLLRQISLKTLLNHPSTPRLNNSPSLLPLAKNVTPRDSLLHSFRVSTTKTHKSNQLNTIISSINEYFTEATFKTAWSEIKFAALRMDKKYYARSLMPYGTTSTADYFTTTYPLAAQTHRS